MQETIVIEPPIGPFEGLVMLAAALIVIIPFWRIFARAGHPGWLGILMALPLINLILLYYLAFSNWPALQNKGAASCNAPSPPKEP